MNFQLPISTSWAVNHHLSYPGCLHHPHFLVLTETSLFAQQELSTRQENAGLLCPDYAGQDFLLNYCNPTFSTFSIKQELPQIVDNLRFQKRIHRQNYPLHILPASTEAELMSSQE
jgi:hypothetical protein